MTAAALSLSPIAAAQAEPDWLWVDDFEPFVSPPEAFRITSLALRDPHLFVTNPPQPPLPALCIDITDNALPGTSFSVNGQIAAALPGDANSDGFLDASTLLLFRPLDQAAPLSRLEQVPARCTSPAATTTCEPPLVPAQPIINFFDTRPAGVCLAPLTGTTGNQPPNPAFPPYSPPIASAIGPFFRTGVRDGVVSDLGVPLPLRDVQFAATFDAPPTDRLVNGLIRGFLPESVADTIQIPLPDPPGGTIALSSVLPGGNNFCAGALGSTRNNQDTHRGMPGWWFYFNVTATRVPYNGH